ncbi:MAG: tRNA pseudouridine(55) synthase TruB [Candidatus Marinimicrobia bacterium]|jgi:tRNA pseudouridine55 synthase|nr:tRNA pseudouridine(55) synthase TruB [Candidatus Neomarinimicrobiota bacterium]|tara:strand:- start:231 stop:872 length:642 start_codon:yes stop_codon:yes gene_type:complete
MIYNIYKPKDFSSFSIVKKIKYITKEKVGHSGTLDPFADGVLVLGVGKSTKKLSSIIQYDKTYEGVIRLGIQTDSMDLTGTVVAEEKIPVITSTMLDQCANSFVGELLQRTPMFSARKIDGVRLYKLARKNISIKTNPKLVTIKNLKIEVIDDNNLKVIVECSSGTYIRVLAEDIAKYLGTVGHLISLTRLSVGEYSLSESLTVESFEEEWKS